MINLSRAISRSLLIVTVCISIAGCASTNVNPIEMATTVLGVPTLHRSEHKVSCELGVGTNVRFVLLSPSECEAENARVKAEIEQQQQEEQRKAEEQRRIFEARQAEAQRQYELTLSEQRKKDEKKGFKSIAFDDFLLDGKELAMRNTKLSIQGFYVKLGAVEFLMSSIIAIEMTRNEITTDRGIALLTEDAPRNVRQYFLNCRNNVATSQIGCPITVLGHATMCEKTTLLGATTAPCLIVDNGR